jgi:hypothetical protein
VTYFLVAADALGPTGSLDTRRDYSVGGHDGHEFRRVGWGASRFGGGEGQLPLMSLGRNQGTLHL